MKNLCIALMFALLCPFSAFAADILIYSIKTSAMGLNYLKTPDNPANAVNRRVQVSLVDLSP